MNRVKHLSQVIRSHIRDITVLHTSTNKVLITVPLYLEKGLILDKVGIVGDQIQIEGSLNPLLVQNPVPFPFKCGV